MRALTLTATALLVLGSSAFGQIKAPDIPSEAGPPTRDPRVCADHNTTGQGAGGGTLSDKLAQSGGVICPPESRDSDIRAPAPGGGETPVIPPPAADQPPQPPE